MSGWFPAERNVWNGEVLARGEMTEVEAWLWLMGQAAYEPTSQNVRGKVVQIPRGSLLTTLRRLAVEWQWASDKRVRTFLRKLEKAGWISLGADAAGTQDRTQDRTQGRTQINICGYCENAQSGRDRDAAADAAGTQDRTLKSNKEEGKNISPDGEIARERASKPAGPKLEDFVRPEVASAFREHRRKKRAPFTARAEASQCKHLAAIRDAGHDPSEALDLCMFRGWQAVEADWFFNAKQKETRHGGRNGPGSDPGFEARLARWEELDARCAGAAYEPGPGGDDGWGGEEARGVDRAPGFGAVVPLFSAGGR